MMRQNLKITGWDVGGKPKYARLEIVSAGSPVAAAYGFEVQLNDQKRSATVKATPFSGQEEAGGSITATWTDVGAPVGLEFNVGDDTPPEVWVCMQWLLDQQGQWMPV